MKSNNTSENNKIQFPAYVNLVIMLLWPYVLLLINTLHLIDDLTVIFVNFMIIWAIEGIILLCTNSALVTEIAITLLYALLCVGNDCLFQIRGIEFSISDLRMAGTALLVGNNYLGTIHLSNHIIIWIVFVLISGVLFFFVNMHSDTKIYKTIKQRLVGGIIVIALIAEICILDCSKYDTNRYYNQNTMMHNGLCAKVLFEIKNQKLAVPTGYSEKTMAELLSDNSLKASNTPNIIVIMSEAFCDYSLIGNLESNTDPLSYFRSLKDNCISGNLYVPVWGGETCNTEWEFLTSGAMTFCGNNIPLQQYIRSDTASSIAASLRNLNYHTMMIHPYYKAGYHRDSIYPMLGFEDCVFLENIDERYMNMSFDERPDDELIDSSKQGIKYVRDLISDETLFGIVIDKYRENKALAKPQFIYAISMQNHGPYIYDKYVGKVKLNDENNAEFAPATQYLSILNETDESLHIIFDYFSQIDDPTIILFFGDHQPGLGNDFYNMLWNYESGNSSYTKEDECKKHLVPYLLWSNYEIDLQRDYNQLSSNYLGMMLLDAADISFDDFYGELSRVYERYNVIEPYALRDSNGEWIYDFESSIDPVLNKYNQMQYYRMFEK